MPAAQISTAFCWVIEVMVEAESRVGSSVGWLLPAISVANPGKPSAHKIRMEHRTTH